ncbi:unnamed protein product [Cunninghamella echinulata]
MLRNTVTTLLRNNTKRAYYSTEKSANSAHNLAQRALDQKTGGASSQFKATLPKGSKKPAKAPEDKSKQKKIIAATAGVITGSLVGGLLYYGRPFDDGREDKYTSENIFSASYHRAIDRYREFRQEMHQPMWDKLLPDPLPQPYQRPYTLVINLDETLVYSHWSKEHGWRHAKRPGVDYFLAYMSQFYEIVIFTSQPAMNAMPIIEKLDPYQYSLYRLYRDGTRYVDGKYLKDLSHLNRDLSKVIIMDSNPDAFSLQPENGIALKPWKGDPKDHGLLDYIPFLEAIAINNPPDIRPVLKQFGTENDIPKTWSRYEKNMVEQHQQQWYEQQKNSKNGGRNLGALLRGGQGQGVAGGQSGEQGPPPTYLEQMRNHLRETFAQEQENMKYQQDQMMKEMELQKEKMKEMKMTVWELMAQVSSVR